nr:MAG TPA: hypothetical protein [Caudoviricetes sp.]
MYIFWLIQKQVPVLIPSVIPPAARLVIARICLT